MPQAGPSHLSIKDMERLITISSSEPSLPPKKNPPKNKQTKRQGLSVGPREFACEVPGGELGLVQENICGKKLK